MRGSVWDETVFTKNRDRLIEGDIARKFMAAVLSQGSVEALLSDDHGGLHARGPPSISDARAAVATLMSCPLVISAGGTVRLKWLKSCC
jgi:hypothetical protein